MTPEARKASSRQAWTTMAVNALAKRAGELTAAQRRTLAAALAQSGGASS